MSQDLSPTALAPGDLECTPAGRVTKSLLGYGVIAGPVYVVTALAQALTRPGFDLSRHSWSLLANGSSGWIQIANFVVTGLMVLAFSVGLGRALPAGFGAIWAPRLLAVYGVSLIAAGIFRADPVGGFPLGTPSGSISWHGLLHLAVGRTGFIAAATACGLLGRRYRAEGHRGWAGFSLLTGAVLLLGFSLEASTGGSRTGTVFFTAAVLLVWAWLSSVAVNRYRRVGR